MVEDNAGCSERSLELVSARGDIVVIGRDAGQDGDGPLVQTGSSTGAASNTEPKNRNRIYCTLTGTGSVSAICCYIMVIQLQTHPYPPRLFSRVAKGKGKGSHPSPGSLLASSGGGTGHRIVGQLWVGLLVLAVIQVQLLLASLQLKDQLDLLPAIEF